MNPVQSSHSTAAAPAPALQTSHTSANVESDMNGTAHAAPVHGYGLPCAKCRTYYDANLSVCPVCKNSTRVEVNAIVVRTASPETKDSAAVEERRRRLAQELGSQPYANPLPAPAVEATMCNLQENHPVNPEAAAVCQACYVRAQQRADLLEAALHIDLKEAAQVVYEAVWADPSDPTKTYQNAAQALLVELHKRAGISAVLAPIHPMAH